MRSLCFVSGTRAEFGLLRPLMDEISRGGVFRTRLVVTGMHLSPEFGLTHREITDQGYTIDERVEILLSSDSEVGVTKSMGLALIGFADAYARLTPDMIVLLGDRFEIFCAAAAAVIARIPVVHLHGGEVTIGAFDDALRHCITKMSFYHFTATEDYRRRVIQLGEDPSRVFTVGALGVDNIKRLKLISRTEIEADLGIHLKRRNLLVSFHPPTLDVEDLRGQLESLLAVLSEQEQTLLVFTRANADTGGRAINARIEDYVAAHRASAVCFASLGTHRYLSLMSCMDAVVGNSSSGIIEAPSLHVPTINVGDRQRGRVLAESVISCDATPDRLRTAIARVYSKGFRSLLPDVRNPYGEGDAARRIAEILARLGVPRTTMKEFHDLPVRGPAGA